MPRAVFGANYPFLPREEILRFEEIVRLARIFAQLGVQKIRLTGGEPLLRRDFVELVRMLAQLREIDEIALTTNGSLLEPLATPLRSAGLSRLTISLDSLDESIHRAINDTSAPLSAILKGIDAAVAAGFSPIKLNMVVRRGVNDHEVVEMAERFAAPPFIVRFIEYMDVGNTNGWRKDDLVPASEIIAQISERLPLTPAPANYSGEVARRFIHEKGGEVGVISAITEPFCRNCTRARLSADGRLYKCLFAAEGFDLRTLLRNGADDEQIRRTIYDQWSQRSDRYSELRSEQPGDTRKAEMSLLGG